ncbi:MAG: tRNA pseudouridine(55) synthase TruB [Candidatus Peregrinibacteria bacterium]|nr:tRNA pseudouridine(55) synthase TruB [Candidatus Peregrinibacteria bacterium]
MDGFFLIDKEVDWTSFDVCARMRKILKIKKIGHTGTLDPFATGLLLVATGKCTKLIPYLDKAKKTYVTKIVLGKTTETLDSESEVIDCEFKGDIPKIEDIQKVLDEKFSGKIFQVPPKFSAIKINGQRAYDLARKGEKVVMKERAAEVFSIKILSYSWPEVEIELEVGAGFYVRSFARDLGEILAGGGYCSELRRTKIDDLSVEDAEKIEMVSSPIEPKFIVNILNHIEIPTGRIQDFAAGRAFKFPGVEGERVLVLCGGKSIGVGEFRAGTLQPRIVL